jgi:hypothetical protein
VADLPELDQRVDEPWPEKGLRFFAVAGKRRLIWHPRVHERYKEYCHIFLLSGQFGFGRRVVDDLNGLFERLQLTPSSISIVYGPYDVLLRIWLTDAARSRFREALRSHNDGQMEIENFLEFAADDIIYDWAQDREGPAELQIAEFDNQIRLIVESEKKSVWSGEANDAQDLLVSKGLLHSLHARRGLKYYMFLQNTKGSQPVDYILDALVEGAKRAEISPEGMTIYAGKGFCSFIIKAIEDDYGKVLSRVESIQELARKLGLRVWSLVPADYGMRPDGETLDVLLNKFPERLDPFLRRVTNDRDAISRIILGLTPMQQEALGSTYARSIDILSLSKERDRFNELLEAVITDQRKEINQTLSFITSIEGDARNVLPRISRLIGEAGEKAMLNALAENTQPGDASSEGQRSQLGNASLSAILGAMRDLAKHDVIERYLNDFLAQNWQKHSRVIVELRNDYMHSRLTEDLLGKDFAGKLSGKLLDLAETIRFQVGLENLRDTLKR